MQQNAVHWFTLNKLTIKVYACISLKLQFVWIIWQNNYLTILFLLWGSAEIRDSIRCGAVTFSMPNKYQWSHQYWVGCERRKNVVSYFCAISIFKCKEELPIICSEKKCSRHLLSWVYSKAPQQPKNTI